MDALPQGMGVLPIYGHDASFCVKINKLLQSHNIVYFMKKISAYQEFDEHMTTYQFQRVSSIGYEVTSTGIDAGASKGKSWPGYSWQQIGLMLRMWDTVFISTLCHCYLSMINWKISNLHVVIPMESDGPYTRDLTQ